MIIFIIFHLHLAVILGMLIFPLAVPEFDIWLYKPDFWGSGGKIFKIRRNSGNIEIDDPKNSLDIAGNASVAYMAKID